MKFTYNLRIAARALEEEENPAQEETSFVDCRRLHMTWHSSSQNTVPQVQAVENV